MRRSRVLHFVSSLDGGPASYNDGCPLCVEAARAGEPVYEVSRDGVRELDASEWPEPIVIDVHVRGDATLWPLMPDEATPVTIPLGCDLEMLVQYLFARDPALRKAARYDGLIARINGEESRAAQLLCEGDQVTLSMAAPVSRRVTG